MNWLLPGVKIPKSKFLIVVIQEKCVVVNVLDCDIVVSEFKLQSRYYVHFRANNLMKDMNPFNYFPPPSYRLNSITAVLQQGWIRY